MCLLLAVMVLGSLRAGFTSLTMGDVFRVLTGGGTREENLILFDFRMVRIVLAVLIVRRYSSHWATHQRNNFNITKAFICWKLTDNT